MDSLKGTQRIRNPNLNPPEGTHPKSLMQLYYCYFRPLYFSRRQVFKFGPSQSAVILEEAKSLSSRTTKQVFVPQNSNVTQSFVSTEDNHVTGIDFPALLAR